LEARNARRAAQGRPTVDVERELAELTRPAAATDPEGLEEVRQLVEARNARRIARGQEPLDVQAEIERQLRDLPGESHALWPTSAASSSRSSPTVLAPTTTPRPRSCW